MCGSFVDRLRFAVIHGLNRESNSTASRFTHEFTVKLDLATQRNKKQKKNLNKCLRKENFPSCDSIFFSFSLREVLVEITKKFLSVHVLLSGSEETT